MFMNNNSEIRISDEFVPEPPELIQDASSLIPASALHDKANVPELREFVPAVDDPLNSLTFDSKEAERKLRERDASKN